MSKSNYSIVWYENIAEVDQTAWDELALPLATPFLEWDWLHQMEVSGSATAPTGWLPQHLTVWSGQNLVAAAPLYIKGHSAGEFVFDHAWADLASRLGIAYYPKLVGMSPFTPMRGYRFLIAPGEDEAALTDIMLHEIDRFCLRYQLSGCSFLFVDPHWQTMIDHPRFSSWMHRSYLWQNRGFKTFEDYLKGFNSNQRRNIKRERSAMATQGISLQVTATDAIPHNHIPIMYDYYVRTNEKFGPWGCKYLNPSFFDGLYRNYRHRLVLVSAYTGGQDQGPPIGMSLLVTKGSRLYGRYWGCSVPVKNLHFNACYYAPIEWAVSSGIESFDPGAGGPHKLRRGFSAVPNYSLHRFADPRLREIMRSHIDEINRLEEVQIEALNQAIPFAGSP
ncbi:MAG: N-acetyltransferase [Deltaproteobacteria bacterium]|jgi:predicted N-acyltransferase|nr:N-acetyltransferase [Deltaproteobacteria bacterium]